MWRMFCRRKCCSIETLQGVIRAFALITPEFMEDTMKKNKYVEIGDIVDMHCGEQGIVIEVIDDDWVLLLQCDGHVEKSHVGDIWKSNIEVDGKAELDSFFTKIFGYSSVYDKEEEELIPVPNEDMPF